MKKLLILLILLPLTVFSSDSGLYFNPERDGEGIQVSRNGDTIQIFFYTYEPNDECWNITIPEGGLVTDDNCHEQRYFFTAGNTLFDNSVATGYLYTTAGLDYPEGLTNLGNPFVAQVGEAIVVAQYSLQRVLWIDPKTQELRNGFRMVFVRFGDVLDEDDPLFTQVYDFPTQLFAATD